MRFFNTEGPNRADLHYCLPPLQRLDLDDLLGLIDQQKYSLLQGPRQTGKTTCLLALTEHLNQAGRYRAVYANLEVAQPYREQVGKAMVAVVEQIARGARDQLGDAAVIEVARKVLQTSGGGTLVGEFLSRWCLGAALPTVLVLDEVDALTGDTLSALLRQLRAGYPQRPRTFPQAVILCGVRDLRDGGLHATAEAAATTGGSTFDILAKSLRLDDFSPAEVTELLQEHTRETGQEFTPEAVARVWTLTQGQPWLVNALAYETCFEDRAGRDRDRAITRERVDEARETLIVKRVPHLEHLTDKLREERVRRVIEPMLAGTALGEVREDDIQYLLDLGLCRLEPGQGLALANPIYREALPRALTFITETFLPPLSPTWLKHDGSLNPDALLDAVLVFWRRHGQSLLASTPYHELAPQLVLMAFLQRVVNGDGSLEREYAIGSGRLALSLRYGALTLGILLKVWRPGAPDPVTAGLAQLDGWLAGLDLDGGWLVIFDRRPGQLPFSERTGHVEATSPQGRTIQVVRA